MKNFLAGVVVGAVPSVAMLALFVVLHSMSANVKLIHYWQQIGPGMHRTEVQQILGESGYGIAIGEGFPDWGRRSVPDNYYLKHSLLAFTIRGVSPHLLLVYLDENDQVVFVSSAPT